MRHQNLIKVVAMTAALGLISLVRAPSADAAEEDVPDHPVLRDAWYISGGALYARSNVVASLNKTLLGTLIDFEDDLGLDRYDWMGLWTVRWHFTKRWQLEVEYFNLDRSNTQSLERNITWGNLNVPVTATAHSRFNIEDFRVGIGYSFFKTQDKEVGIGLGAHVARLQAGLTTTNFGSEETSESAPLPFITTYVRLALTDRWLLSMRVDRLSLSSGDIDGSVFSSGLDVIYSPWRHFSFGLGYRDIDWQISSSSNRWNGRAQVQESGPMVFIATQF
ncbi:MAG TPA: hypothetical protein VNR40_16085 [Steroidobacter sp.]|nr:hypothetical protein [Steroidobacter sp.]